MKQLDLQSSLATFTRLFTSAQRTMFKAEVLQDYTAVDDSPSLRAWLAGNREQARKLAKVDQSIINYRRQCLKSPAVITRVHTVRKPYTSYLEWEVAACYKDNLLKHGAEKIYLVDAKSLSNIRLPAGDFWIFDYTQVLQWCYQGGVGRIVGGQLWDKSQGDSIEHFQQLRSSLLAAAKPVD